jgi:hypothetical protein
MITGALKSDIILPNWRELVWDEEEVNLATAVR